MYPKKRSVTYPCVSARKSNGAPDVSVRVNCGLVEGRSYQSPAVGRFRAIGAGCVGGTYRVDAADNQSLAASKSAAITQFAQKDRSFVDMFMPRLMDNHAPGHAHVVMKRADVVEGTRSCERHAEPRHAQIRLREPDPVLGSRNEKPRVHAAGW